MEKKTRHLKVLLAAAGLVVVCCLHAAAGDLKIVANASVKADSLSLGELRSVFTAETNSLKDGSHVEPVFQRSGAAHETFLREFLKESSDSLSRRYGALVFTGKASMPKSFDSEAEVLAYVAKTKGAIGYVSASASTEGVKVLEVGRQAGKSERRLVTRVEPEYPETLRKLHIGGVVRLQVTISPQGSVESVFVLGGNPILGESAVNAVKQWVYAPSGGRSTMEVSIPFEAPQ
jgi:TonB family protein